MFYFWLPYGWRCSVYANPLLAIKEVFVKPFIIFIFHNLLILTLISCEHYCEPEIYLIQDNYKGPIYVVFNQKQGIDKEYELGKRIYRIPENGILLSKFKADFGIIDQEFFYLTNDLRRLKLYDIPIHNFTNGERDYKYKIKPSQNGLYVISSGTAGVCGIVGSDVRWLFAFIGTYKEFIKYQNITSICETLNNGQ